VDAKALHAAAAGRPVRVRLAGRGTTASVDIRLDPQLQAMVAAVAAAAKNDATSPRSQMAMRPYRVVKRFDAIVRNAAGGGNDLATRMLDELTAGLARTGTQARTFEPGTGGA
jgi:hypothetical protein